MKDILEFCFRNFWTYAGISIWILFLTNHFKNFHPIAKAKRFSKEFFEKFMNNYRKNKELEK